jgi:hypothetical protein
VDTSASSSGTFEFLRTYAAEWMIESGLFVGLRPKATNTVRVPIMNCRLTPAGWKRYTELSQSVAASRFGFVAMKYGDAELDALARKAGDLHLSKGCL